MGLDERRVVRTAVALAGGDNLYGFGSGYVVADGLVLTAAHVLEPAPGAAPQEGHRAEVARLGGGWQQATVAWVDAGQDVAVLACPGLTADGEVRWGRLAGADPLDWGAVGFPRASVDDEHGRQAEHAFGRTSPISARAAGRLALTVESREASEAGEGNSPWAGLSGAAVFCGDFLVGVIVADAGSYNRSLVGRRAEDFCRDSGLARLLGRVPAVEDVAGKVREPGLPDLRSTLRSRNRAFTGRTADLGALSAVPRGRTVLTQSLVGLGGVGKSAVALEYAHRRYRAGDADLAWWFVAEDRPLLLASMARLYERLMGKPSYGEDAGTGAVALRNWLERSPYRWIVIFDNAEPGTLDGILPEDGTGQVIITSRASDWRDVGAIHEIGALPTEEAVALLAEITGLPADQDARQVADELGGLALAIEQAGAYIRQTHVGFLGYLRDLRSDPQIVYNAGLARSESVAARVWRRSLDHVTGGRDDDPAAVILGVMSYLAPDDIPRQLFTAGAIQATPILADTGAVKLTTALARLAAYSLITLDRDTVSVHRVIQHLTRIDATARGRAADYSIAAIGLLAAAADAPRAERLPAGRLLPHVGEASAHAGELGAVPGDSVRVLGAVATELLAAGQLNTVKPAFDRALAIAQAQLGTDHPETLTARRNLGRWLGESGQATQARDEFAQLLKDHIRVLGPDHPDTLTTQFNLICWRGVVSNWSEGTSRELRKLLLDYVRVLGREHPGTLAVTAKYFHYYGRAESALVAAGGLRSVVADMARVLGRDHPDTLAARLDLAQLEAEADQEDLRHDEYELDEALEEWTGGDPDLLYDRDDLWEKKYEIEMLKREHAEEAAGNTRELLEDMVRQLGPDHPHTLATRKVLATWLSEAGQAQEAASELRRLVTDMLRVLGPDHPATLATRKQLQASGG